MYKFKKTTKTNLSINESYEGETIEAKVRRIVPTAHRRLPHQPAPWPHTSIVTGKQIGRAHV